MAGSFERMRQGNREHVLAVIRGRGPIARVEIAEVTGLTRPTVSDIVAELISEGWVAEVGPAGEGPGRKSLLLEFVPGARLVLGIDVGITRVRAGLLDLNASLLRRGEVALGADRSPSAVVAAAGRAVAEALAGQEDRSRGRLLGAGVGMHGLVDAHGGISRFAPHFGWHDVPIRELLEQRLGLPVIVDNDVRAMALGESLFGNGRAAGTLVCLNVGTGIGAGIVMEGKPLRGLHGAAGEIGHTKVVPGGRLCTCGGRGCLETVASAPAIAEGARLRLTRGEPSILDLRSVTGEAITAAARAGDLLARTLLAEAGSYLGIALANLVHLLNPDVIAVGGGLSGAGELLLAPLTERLRREALPGLTDGLRITVVQRGADAGIVGAAALMLPPLSSGGVLP